MRLTHPKSDKDKQRLLAQEKQRVIHNLVVKVISWKAGLLDGATIQQNNKITSKEWGSYKQHILRISKIDSLERVKNKLRDTQEAIKAHGGFE